MKNQPGMEAGRLNFLDESSVNLGMTRLYGRAPAGERINDYVPDVRFERTSIISTVRLDGGQIPFVFKGTLNGALFKSYTEQFLAPALSAGDILLMDNSSAHKTKGAVDALLKKGVTVMFIPRYSPDFNPIELLWSKLKAFLHKIKARTPESLLEAIKLALDTISTDDIEGWFRHCGYLANVSNV